MQITDARALRRASLSPSSRRARRIVAIAAFGAADSLLVALRQTGALRHLPDPPFARRVFDSDFVTTSLAAYEPGAPDATLGALMFTGVAVAATAFANERGARRRFFALAAAATAVGGAIGAIHYLREMSHLRRWCVFCLGTAAASFALLPDVFAEAYSSSQFALRDQNVT